MTGCTAVLKSWRCSPSRSREDAEAQRKQSQVDSAPLRLGAVKGPSLFRRTGHVEVRRIVGAPREEEQRHELAEAGDEVHDAEAGDGAADEVVGDGVVQDRHPL